MRIGLPEALSQPDGEDKVDAPPIQSRSGGM